MTLWAADDGTIDVTASFQGFTQPLSEILDDIHSRGWTVAKIKIKDEQYVAEGKNPHGEKIEANGRTEATAAGNLLVKIMRREHIRSSSLRLKLGAWDHRPIEAQLQVIAQAYVKAPTYDPKAASSWMELAQDCQRRADIIQTQVAIEYTDDPVPYQTADELREDVVKKHHIWISRAYAHHPIWSEQQMLTYRLVVDVLGHSATGGDWGWHGACMAFAALAPLLAEEPQKALFTELLGQTAYGTTYRGWGPQKIAFLEDEITKLQEKENGPGHAGVHPSQSIVPGEVPRIGKVAGKIMYHLSPVRNRASIQQRGLLVEMDAGEERTEPGIYLSDHPITSTTEDTWAVMVDGLPLDIDPMQYDYASDPALAEYAGTSDYYTTVDIPPDRLSLYQAARTASVAVSEQLDPNANWDSGITPLPDAAYLWQRQNGTDPLDIHTHMDGLRQLEPGLAKMHPEMAKQAVVNALRQSVLGARTNPMGHAVHYQDVMHMPAGVDDPIAFWDAFERSRENFNQSQGYAPKAHRQHWAQEQQFKQWVRTMNPHLDDGQVTRLAQRELLHMLTEEEERILSQDEGEQMPAELVEHEAYEALKRRLKGLTKPTLDQKVDFGDSSMYHEAAGGRYYRWLPTSIRDQVTQNGMVPNPNTGNRMHFWDNLENAQRYGEICNSIEPHDLWEVRGRPGRLKTDPWFKMVNYPEYGDRPGAWQSDAESIPPDRLRLLSKTSTYHADMYPPYLASSLRPLGAIGRHADALAQAAREDLLQHKGYGHHFRSKALQLGLPKIGPRQISNAWLHLAPQTSQLAVVDPVLSDLLGHDYTPDPRDYFKHERELAAARDAGGYNHVPLGGYSSALWDMSAGGPGWHPDRTALKALGPTPVGSIDWRTQVPTHPGIQGQYWWDSTQQARDQVGQDFDRTIATQTPSHEVPYQRLSARLSASGRSPWLTHPATGQRLTGAPGTSLMSHVMTTMGHPDCRSVWAQDYEVGKGEPGTIAKVAMPERTGNPELDAALAQFMAHMHNGDDNEVGPIEAYRDPQQAWGQCQMVAEACAAFLKERGFNAYCTNADVDEFYPDAQDSAAIGAGDFSYPEHSVVTVYLPTPGVLWGTPVEIDFTASQYGYTEFPKVDYGPPGPLIGPQQQDPASDPPDAGTIAKVASFSDQDVQRFLDSYLEAALWSSTDDNGEPLDARFGPEHIDPVTLGAMREEAVQFLHNNEALIEQYLDAGHSLDQAGHDFWLTRNGHGTGFWDRDLGAMGAALTNASKQHGESDLYMGDDQLLHGSNYGEAYQQRTLDQMADPQSWQHPDPWMDSEPGAETFPESWVHWGRRRRGQSPKSP